MKRAPLLAKSLRDPVRVAGSESLRGHTLLVLRAAQELLAICAEASLSALGLPAALAARLRQIVRLAVVIHDLGKANDQFQAMVRHRREPPQLIKHEALSAWLTWPGQPLAAWLRPAVASDEDYAYAVLAAAGHHRRFAADAMASRDSGAGTSITLLLGHTDFADLLRAVGTALSLPAPARLADRTLELSRRWSPQDDFEDWESMVADKLRGDAHGRKLLAVAKAFVLDADVAGSALPRADGKPGWIRTQLTRRATPAQLAGIVTRRLNGKPPRPFQQAVAACTAPVALVRAGCGSGKTAAAYLWAGQQHAGRQLWVTYPTTGTTTEGFHDYLLHADVEARLEHSRAELDLEMLGVGGGGMRDRDRLDALRAWGVDVVTCTVDTVLGLLQNQRKGLYAWASLAHAAVVFDEIHAYDDQLFANLLCFLSSLPGVPVLLMTASLPDDRLAVLQEVVSATHGRALAVIDGPAELEALPRYVRHASSDPWREVDDCLARDGKVLWINNTVDRCLGVAAAASGRALIYHSRFRYADRVERHAAVIRAFRAAGPALAITTQVAEMSLDLSADLLILDFAPVPAVIQRLGRLNRKATVEDPGTPRPFVVVPYRGLPYAEADYAAAETWLGALGSGPLSQRDLVTAWITPSRPRPAIARSRWIDGGFHTTPDAVREESYGLTVLRAQDATEAARSARAAVASALPMGPPPRTLRWRSWPMVRGYPVAPESAIDYDPMRGAAWQR